MKKVLFVINIAAFIVSLAWLTIKPNFDSLISILLTLGGLISFVFIKPNSKEDKKGKLIMTQKAGKKSKQYQSGHNMTINN